MNSYDLSTVALLVSVAVLGIQTIILWRQTKILDTQTKLSEIVDFSVELIRSTVNTQSLCVNIKNEGKGLAHNPIFDYYLERNNAVLLSGSQELQTIGAGSAENLIFNTSGPVPIEGTLRLYWKGTRSDGRAFTGSRDIPLSSANVTNRQFGVS